MFPKTMTSLAFAAACLGAAALLPGTAAQAASHTRSSAAVQTPAQNVKSSQHYTRMVATSRAFRETRMRKECGPIADPALRQSCLASFHQEVADWHAGNTGAFYGSSSAPQAPSGAGQ